MVTHEQTVNELGIGAPDPEEEAGYLARICCDYHDLQFSTRSLRRILQAIQMKFQFSGKASVGQIQVLGRRISTTHVAQVWCIEMFLLFGMSMDNVRGCCGCSLLLGMSIFVEIKELYIFKVSFITSGVGPAYKSGWYSWWLLCKATLCFFSLELFLLRCVCLLSFLESRKDRDKRTMLQSMWRLGRQVKGG